MALPDHINLDGTQYNVADLSDDVKQLLMLRERWTTELTEETNAVIKTQQAIRSLDLQLITVIQAELSHRTTGPAE